MGEWRGDVLGDGFECRDLDLGEDDEGPLGATLVRALPQPAPFWDRFRGRRRLLDDCDILYIHGWSDYFFQRELAHFFTERGASFYALELRKYGRSLRAGQTHGYIEDLADYDAEIDEAVRVMGHGPAAEQPHLPKRPLLLLGHSTGGLVLSLWADRNRGLADALILNSPWLELQLAGPLRGALAGMVNLRARLNPHELALPRIDLGFYSHAQREIFTPEEAALINAEWRPDQSLPVRAGWLKAIIAGHSQVAAGVDVGAPVCTLLSARSHFGLSWRDDMLSADTVLEVDGVARASLRLGKSVTVERIDGALHDVFLSQPAPRAEAYCRLDRWLTGWSAQHVAGTG